MERRPRSSAKPKREGVGRKLSATQLHDLSRSPSNLGSLASYKALSKSAVGFGSATKDVVRSASKQAWAPPVKQNLSSSSDRFRTETPLPPNPSTPFMRTLREFGRVRARIAEKCVAVQWFCLIQSQTNRELGKPN